MDNLDMNVALKYDMGVEALHDKSCEFCDNF
jgi:hypothetical protein